MKKRRGKIKTKLIAEATLKISVMLAIVGGAGYWTFAHFDELKNFDPEDISRFLNSDKVIEQEAEDYIDDLEQDNEQIENEDKTSEPSIEEDNSQAEENTIPYPDIIPEIDFERTSSEIYDMDITIPSIDWDKVNEANEEANAWLYLPGVGTGKGLSLPVVQGTDNEYYLHHDIDGNEDSRGTLFIDWRNNPMDNGTQELSDVTCIFGHNMKSGSMFASLANYKSQSFYDRHPYGVIIAENGDVYKIDFFAGVIVDGSDELNVYASDFIDESQFNAYFDNIVSNSTFTSDCRVEFGDKIVCLQTCSYEYNGAKFLLYGRLTKQLLNEQEVQSTLGK